jgi:Zn-finger nucleic acid-binding protein
MSEAAPCPACEGQALQQADHAGVPYLSCASCRGAFMRQVRLGEFVEASSGSVGARKAFWMLFKQAVEDDVPSPKGTRRCPICRQRLDRFGFGESPFLIADRCDDHGVWLDEEDLERVVRASRAAAAVHDLEDEPPEAEVATVPKAPLEQVGHVMQCPNCRSEHPGAPANSRCPDCNVLMFML